MKVPCRATIRRRPRRWLRRAVLYGVPALLLTTVAIGLLAERTIRAKVGDWAKTQAFHVYDRSVRLRTALSRVPWRMLRPVDAPPLWLDVKFEHMQRIWRKRDEALAKGLLETAADDRVPGALTADGRVMKVDLRLKGDWTDHLQGDKWSFRIEVRGDAHAFGMRRFSIQAPQTRGYQGEAVFFRVLESLGVLAPRHRFVTVQLNGTDMGLMALEEHFGRELLERSRRREGPIVRFDETLVFHGVDDYRVAPITVFEPRRLAKSPTLAAQRDAATALLHGFVRGTMAPSEVFRIDRLAAYLAAAELFGSHHCLRWHNLRFYYDPIRGRLEPIGFDANLHERQPPTTRVTADEPIVRDMLADPIVRKAFDAAVADLCRKLLDERFVAPLRALDRELAEQLQPEYLMLEPMRWDLLAETARRRLEHPDAQATTHSSRMIAMAGPPPIQARAWLLPGDADGPRVELANASRARVEVTRLAWRRGDEEHPCTVRRGRLPVPLPRQREDGPPDVQTLDLEPPPDANGGAFSLLVESRLPNGRTSETTALPWRHPATSPPVPTSSVAEQLRRHTFLTLDADGRTLRVAAGDWPVDGVLVVPPGNALHVPAGTTLRFPAHGALIAHGPVQLDGEPDRIIELTGVDEAGWNGVAVLDPGAEVAWRHAVVRRTTGLRAPGWELTAGVCFVGARVTLAHVWLDGSVAEDALNIVDGTFRLEGLRVTDTRSDAFDADFADGTVHGGEFRGIGGDAVDVSGSVVEVDGTRFADVRDKALSVGEGSTMRARGVHVERAGTGAASKDASRLELSDATIVDAGVFAMAAYVKKPEFGVAAIHAQRVSTIGAAPRAVAQVGSSVTVDGVAVEPSDLDVDALYATAMRKEPGR